MADDRDQKDQNTSDLNSKNPDKSKRVIGEGMTSLDSTQAPLKAETGEPDRDAMTGGKGWQESDEDDHTSKR